MHLFFPSLTFRTRNLEMKGCIYTEFPTKLKNVMVSEQTWHQNSFVLSHFWYQLVLQTRLN